MRIDEMNAEILGEAQSLAQANFEAEPAIERVYLFPSNDEVRLIEVDSTTRPHNEGKVIMPFYFGASIADGIRFPCAIALVRPEEVDTHVPPEEWGSWNEAQMITRP